MKKYYIGLIIIGLVTLGLTGFTVFQASSAKQDTHTSQRAQDISAKLNNFVATNGVPESLADANIKDVPSTITYTKKDTDKYEFCVTYKHAGSDYDSVGLTQILTGSLQGQLYGDGGYDNYPSADNSSYTPSSLYLPYTHKAGKTCQTVQTYNYYDQYNKPSNDPYGPICDGGLCGSAGTSQVFNANDTERKADINALHGQVEAYYAQNGYYPTLANLNDSAWRSTNMKGLDKEALRDPKGTGYVLTAAATKNSYSYAVSDSANKPCDNKTGNECTFYTLAATLDNGSLYTKISLN